MVAQTIHPCSSVITRPRLLPLLKDLSRGPSSSPMSPADFAFRVSQATDEAENEVMI
jgi:hypothetical protein